MASKHGYGADLSKYMDKTLDVRLNGNRRLVGKLRGYDQFMNLVLEGTVEKESKLNKGKDEEIGVCMIRGNSILLWECMEKIVDK